MRSTNKPLSAAPKDAASFNLLGFAAYGLLGMPLAMSALPVYVQIPSYYASHLGLTLASTGWVLFLARLFDTIQDPLLGRLIDRLDTRLSLWLLSAGVILALAFFGLWLPQTPNHLAVWLAVMLMITYTAHSMINITYLAWGARLSAASQTSNGVMLGAVAWREGAGLAGVILASIVPSMILASDSALVGARMTWYSLGFGLLLLLGILALLRRAPAWQRSNVETVNWRAALQTMMENRGFRRLLAPYFLNALSVAIPATLALFFINDRLQAPQSAAAFLACYFIAAALGLPMWVALAKRFGVMRCWRLGMGLAILAFCGAVLLNAGDLVPYFFVCVAAGLALGADLALPPVLLAQVIDKDEAPAIYFGVWTLLGKLALALSGLTLPLLAYFGYQSGTSAGPILAWAYAGLPCLFKFLALLFLMHLKPAPLQGNPS